ncbi:MAG: hypothetical protein WBK20_04770 [Spirochaetota bacterium]
MDITIITDSGPHIGQGHWQRMLLFAWYCLHNGIPVTLVHKHGLPDFSGFPVKLSNSVGENTSCIIRDMRDSSKEEIEQLRAIAPVIVIDDCGEGRHYATAAIDLLPNIYGKTANTFESTVPLFLYGYNLYQSLLQAEAIISKDIDCFIYATTFDATVLCDILGKHYSFVCSDGNTFTTNTALLSRTNYSNLIAHSKVVISHFGISIYEALLCACHCIILNPTAYHNELSHTLQNTTMLVHHQLYNHEHIPQIIGILKNFLEQAHTHVDTAHCISTIQTNLKNFYDALRLIITS